VYGDAYDRRMRGLVIGLGLGLSVLGACSNDVDPRVIPGGGIGDGEIDGEVNVSVIDIYSEEPIAGAKVTIGESEKSTSAKGFATFSDLEGRQTITVSMNGYRNAVWVGANGANVTIPLTPQTGAPDSATLAGTINGYSGITVGNGHVKGAAVIFSQTDRIGDAANDLKTPNDTNVCLGDNCNWSVVTRTGSVTLLAIVVDRDLHGTPLNLDDDTNQIIGYAYKAGITVSAGVNQSGFMLDMVEAGNLETVTMDLGSPPAGLQNTFAIPGIEVGEDEVIQLPTFFLTKELTVLVPKRTVFGTATTYRLTGIAQTPAGNTGAQSFVLRQGLINAGNLMAGEWLDTPVSVDVTRTTASWEPVEGAKLHSVIWNDGTNDLLEISVFDGVSNEVEVPNSVALPSSGMLTAKVQALGIDVDLNDFSLEDDSAALWGVSVQPTTIP
jgi:hypothetical protein